MLILCFSSCYVNFLVYWWKRDGQDFWDTRYLRFVSTVFSLTSLRLSQTHSENFEHTRLPFAIYSKRNLIHQCAIKIFITNIHNYSWASILIVYFWTFGNLVFIEQGNRLWLLCNGAKTFNLRRSHCFRAESSAHREIFSKAY